MSQTLKITMGDIDINQSHGRANTISGTSKLSQDMLEFFTIEVLDSGYGAGIEQLIGISQIDASIFASLADRQIRTGIQQFRRLQQQDSRITRDPNEKILALGSLQVAQDLDDKTRFFFRANILTEANKTLVLPAVTIGV